MSSDVWIVTFYISFYLISAKLLWGTIKKKPQQQLVTIPKYVSYFSNWFESISGIIIGFLFADSTYALLLGLGHAVQYFGISFLLALFTLTFMNIIEMSYSSYDLALNSFNKNKTIPIRCLGLFNLIITTYGLGIELSFWG
jgi:hypothetical protein